LAVRVAAAIRLAYLPRERLSRDEQTAFLRALDEFRASQALSLDHAGGHLALGALDRHFGERLRRAGSPQEAADLDLRAVQHWQSAIRVEPYIAGPRGELASMLEQLGGDPADIRQLRDEEIKLLERDAKLLPEDGDVRYRIGMMRVLVGELEEATAALQEACRQQPSSGVFRLALALVHQRRYEMSGDEAQFQAAARELRALHELQPSDPTAANVLRELLQTRQRKQQPSAERSPP
jgi:tetratricopeptide (TPR) repeat protein